MINTVGTYLFARITSDGHDSRFDRIRSAPSKFYVAFFAQATWVSLCLLPVMLTNSLPRSAFALSRLANVAPGVIPQPVSASPYWTDILGVSLFLFGGVLLLSRMVDHGTARWKNGVELEIFLCSKSTAEPDSPKPACRSEASEGQIAAVRAELEHRYPRRHRARRDSSLEIMRRTMARVSRQENDPAHTR